MDDFSEESFEEFEDRKYTSVGENIGDIIVEETIFNQMQLYALFHGTDLLGKSESFKNWLIFMNK